jgi:hypothetical protein
MRGVQMKIFTKSRRLSAIAVIVAAITIASAAQWASAGPSAQNEALSPAMDGLIKQGVPVGSWSVDGSTLAVTLKSASMTSVGTPDDPIHLSLVQREAFLAKSRGIDLSNLQLKVINAQGEVLFAGDIVLDKKLDADWSAAAALSETDTVLELGSALTAKADLSGLSLDPIILKADSGTRELHVSAVAFDVKSANLSTTSLMISLRRAINDMNSLRGAQIAIARVDITDAKGEPLLKWIYDVQRSAQDWWQAPGMTTDWFETPGPAAGATEVK